MEIFTVFLRVAFYRPIIKFDFGAETGCVSPEKEF
jgi:hypothetical protein